MLNDEIIDKLSERLVRRIEQGNEYILKVIGKNLRKIKDLTPQEANKIANVLKYGGDYEKILNKLSKISKLNKKDIEDIFEAVAKKETQFAKKFYEYKNAKYIPYRKNKELRDMVNSIKRITKNQYANITDTRAIGYGVVEKNNIIVKGLKEAYYDIIDEGVLNIAQGKETFDEFLERQIEALGEGMKVIYPTTYVDKDGVLRHYTKRIDSAIKQQINDGLSELHTKTQEQIGKDFGSDGVEITVVINPAPDHEEVQGHQFYNKEFKNFQNDKRAVDVKGKVYEPEVNGYDRRSIGQYNCRHLAYSIIIGVNIPQYTDEQLKKIIEDNHNGFEFEGKKYSMYEGSQMQRQIETAVRDNKYKYMLAKETNSEKEINKTRSKINMLEDKYKKLNKASGLPTYTERMQLGPYDRLKRKTNYINTHLPDLNNRNLVKE